MYRVFGKRFYLVLKNTAFAVSAITAAGGPAGHRHLSHSVGKHLGNYCILSHISFLSSLLIFIYRHSYSYVADGTDIIMTADTDFGVDYDLSGRCAVIGKIRNNAYIVGIDAVKDLTVQSSERYLYLLGVYRGMISAADTAAGNICCSKGFRVSSLDLYRYLCLRYAC